MRKLRRKAKKGSNYQKRLVRVDALAEDLLYSKNSYLDVACVLGWFFHLVGVMSDKYCGSNLRLKWLTISVLPQYDRLKCATMISTLGMNIDFFVG